mmetsp:Transcript_13468/g.32146  ORF Transcript_13468/g.32146 Transcript_13468/m.32146 type:complete len:243 (-) Transcript_13468:903-1631(-)
MQIHVHEGRLRSATCFPAHNRRDVSLHDVGLPHEGLRHVDAPHIRFIRVLVFERPVIDFYRRHSLCEDGLQHLACFLSGSLGLIVHDHPRICWRLLNDLFVLVLTDLHKRNKARKNAFLCRLSFHVQALPDCRAGQHLCNGVLARWPIHREPGGLFTDCSLQLVRVQRTSGSAAVASLVEVGDEFSRICEILLLLQVVHGTQQPLELAPAEHEDFDLGHACHGCCSRLVLEKRAFSEEVPRV